MAKDWEFKSRNALKQLAYKKFERISRQELIDEILELRTQVRELEKKNKNLDQALKTLDKGQLSNEKSYKQSWSFATKIVFLLNKSNAPLTSLQLHQQLLKIDTHYPDYDNPKSNLSVVLDRGIHTQRIAKIKLPGIKELYFVLPEWLDEKGKLEKSKQDLIKQF